eukprot:4414211-Amphidinium_carterae.3
MLEPDDSFGMIRWRKRLTYATRQGTTEVHKKCQIYDTILVHTMCFVCVLYNGYTVLHNAPIAVLQ